jgi:hypothetical protein
VCKTRVGAKVAKRDETATTPAQRLLSDHPDLLCDADRNSIGSALDTVNSAKYAAAVGVNQPMRLKQIAVGIRTTPTRNHQHRQIPRQIAIASSKPCQPNLLRHAPVPRFLR